MINIVTNLKNAAQKRAAYNRTVTELRRLPTDIALDLGIYPGDADSIARKVVYGK